MKLIARVLSGGQTGVDRAAWDAAIEVGVPHDGWVLKGRLAEDGVVPDRYRFCEALRSGYPARTKLNVEWADATLILVRDSVGHGSQLTRRLTGLDGRPAKLIYLGRCADRTAFVEICAWLDRVEVPDQLTLNVAGPRESREPGWARSRVQPLLARLFRQRGLVVPREPLCGPEGPGPDS